MLLLRGVALAQEVEKVIYWLERWQFEPLAALIYMPNIIEQDPFKSKTIEHKQTIPGSRNTGIE